MEVCAYDGNQLKGLSVTAFAYFVQLLRASPDNHSSMHVCSVGGRGSCLEAAVGRTAEQTCASKHDSNRLAALLKMRARTKRQARRAQALTRVRVPKEGPAKGGLAEVTNNLAFDRGAPSRQMPGTTVPTQRAQAEPRRASHFASEDAEPTKGKAVSVTRRASRPRRQPLLLPQQQWQEPRCRRGLRSALLLMVVQPADAKSPRDEVIDAARRASRHRRQPLLMPQQQWQEPKCRRGLKSVKVLAAGVPRRGPPTRFKAMESGLLMRRRGGQDKLAPRTVVGTCKSAWPWWVCWDKRGQRTTIRHMRCTVPI